MERREFLKSAAAGGMIAAAGGFPSLSSAQSSKKTLRFVPQSDLANFDPIWGTQYVVRNASIMVWDMLYGIDSNMKSQRQMVESEEVSSDGLTWTFTLRKGLKFHDGQPVLSKDVIASLKRWQQRNSMGLMIRDIQTEITPIDDMRFKWVLKKPFPKMLDALGTLGTPCPFIMPERIAQTDPFKQITEYIGSGPMRFVRNEWVPGAKAVFERFEGYVPRTEPASWMAGGKKVLVDRVEWIIMPDPATASAALQNGEIDWWENPIADLIPVLKSGSGIVTEIADPLGNVGSFRMNHLYPPFNDVKARRAVLMAMSQQDYMQAIVGESPELWKPMAGFFTPGTPTYTEVGGDIFKGPRNLDAAKKLLVESGYKGEPVTCVVAQNQTITKAMGEVTADLLKRLGMKVDFVATDWGTVGTRRASKAPPAQGGWNMFHSWHVGADCANPAGYNALRANGDKAWFGWPKDDKLEAEVQAWYDAAGPAQEKAAIEALNKEATDFVVYAPTGFFLQYTAWRSNVTGISKGPMPFIWGVNKT
ncbi:ABC transporter substrate-binding protein [Bordetella sp. N]|uniref:ABC transporter substrate-binding protein n=1 Tax=Bordetella sp. N TaxID=1746199 RepID=UPI00070EA180|nr:ABC transporter substrate-binding protein [Bordetella sp. N]ALM81577.1 ABC transporter substrate-binding protein [Bordetella sp. N]